MSVDMSEHNKRYVENEERKHWRYEFAKAAMQGYITHGEDDSIKTARWSVADADALLAELEKETNNDV